MMRKRRSKEEEVEEALSANSIRFLCLHHRPSPSSSSTRGDASVPSLPLFLRPCDAAAATKTAWSVS